MANYFSPSHPTDLNLLRDGQHQHDALRLVADEAEQDAINHYVRSVPSSWTSGSTDNVPAGAVKIADRTYVLLDGYAKDAANADGYDSDRSAWSGFAAAFRRAIAKVIRHRLRYWDEDLTLTSKRQGARSQTREGRRVDPDWPDGWNRGLRRYDLKKGVYHI